MYLIVQRPRRLFYDVDAAYFQGWSSWNPARALWYDREHAKRMTRAEAERVAAWWPGVVEIEEVDS